MYEILICNAFKHVKYSTLSSSLSGILISWKCSGLQVRILAFVNHNCYLDRILLKCVVFIDSLTT